MRAFTVRALQSFFKHDNDDMMKQASTDSDSRSTPASADRLPRVRSEDSYICHFSRVGILSQYMLF